MVKKLFKHEFLAWVRLVPLFFVIAPLAAAMYQLLGLFAIDNLSFDLIRGLTLFAGILALIPCIGAPIVFGVTRFYKNLFTGEGYLSFTLPVKTSHQIWVKVITGGVFSIVSIIVAFLSLVILLAGAPLREIVDAIDLAILLMPDGLRTHLPLYIIEIVLLLCVGMFANHLQYYSCICLGQTTRKNRILSAIAAYFLYSVIAQALSTVVSVAMLLLEDTAIMTAYYDLMAFHPYAAIHVHLLLSLLLCVLLSAVYYLICHHVMEKKLNLE